LVALGANLRFRCEKVGLGLERRMEMGRVGVVHEIVDDELIMCIDREMPADGGTVFAAQVHDVGRVDNLFVVALVPGEAGLVHLKYGA
jgi:hypothetical protein